MLEPAGDSQNVDIDRTYIQGIQLTDEGEYRFYIFCPITSRDIELAPDELILWLFDEQEDRSKAAFTLLKTESEKAVYLNADAALSDATIKNVSLTQTPFASYLEIDYAYEFDYFKVPAFYIDGQKVHEGAITKEEVKRVLEAALE